MRDLVDAQLLFAAVQSVQVVRSPQHCYALSVCVRHREFGRTLCGSWQLRKFGRGVPKNELTLAQNIMREFTTLVHIKKVRKPGKSVSAFWVAVGVGYQPRARLISNTPALSCGSAGSAAPLRRAVLTRRFTSSHDQAGRGLSRGAEGVVPLQRGSRMRAHLSLGPRWAKRSGVGSRRSGALGPEFGPEQASWHPEQWVAARTAASPGTVTLLPCNVLECIVGVSVCQSSAAWPEVTHSVDSSPPP